MFLRKAAVVASVGVLGGLAAYNYETKYLLLANARYRYYQLGLKQGSVTVGGLTGSPITLTYLHRPAAAPSSSVPYLFVHGYNGSVDIWLDTIKYLPSEQEVIAVNLPAHGSSNCDPNTDLTLHGLAHRLAQFADAVGLTGQQLHVVGQSMGATVAAMYSADHSNVDRVTIIAPAMWTPEPSDMVLEYEGELRPHLLTMDEDSYDLPPIPLIPSTAEEMEDAIHWCINRPSGLSKQILQGLIDLKKPHLEHMKQLFVTICHDTWESKEKELMKAYAPRITAPVQIVWGEKDKVCHISGLDYLAKLVPNCQSRVFLANTGHSINMICPEVLAVHLTHFHDKHKQK